VTGRADDNESLSLVVRRRATMALSVLMLQGGIRDVMQAQGSVWTLKLAELLTTIIGGGCSAAASP